MPHIQYSDRQIQYEIQRGNRKKTVALHVDTDTVTIRVPQRLSEERISQFMTKKARWIYDRQALIRGDSLNRVGKNYVNGEPFPYLGHTYKLLIVKDAPVETPVCKLWRGSLRVYMPVGSAEKAAKSAVKEVMITWYHEQAAKKIAERLPALAAKIGVQPKTIAIRNQKSQWGSCSRSGAVRFNWKIIMAPVAILDYIIVHELCHLVHNHHQTQFWKKVQSIIPDYQVRKDWLREHSILITALS